MTTLNDLLAKYTLEEEYNIEIDECPCLKLNKYNVGVDGNDVVFQFTIVAKDVKEAFIYIHGEQIQVVPKRVLPEQWVICLIFPNIAIRALTFGGYIKLYLPDAVNIQRIVKLSKRFISKDRKLIGNELLRACGSLSFDIQGKSYTIYNSF
jgi:hypothetical protein